MCNYCESKIKIFIENILSPSEIEWCNGIKAEDVKNFEHSLGVFIDRGYLRFVDLLDSQCLDHGHKIKLNYCPFCGIKFEVSNA